MAAKDKNIQPRVVSPIEVSPRLVEPKAIKYPFGGTPPTPPPEPPAIDFWGLKLTMPEGGTVVLRKNGSPNAVSLEVSTDGDNWQPWTLVGTDYSYTLEAGQTLCIRNTSTTFVQLSFDWMNYYQFVFVGTVEASGSVMSLSVNDETVLSLASHFGNFINLFKDCTSLVSAPELPATTLSPDCYNSMFKGCTSLTTGPVLPFTTPAEYCCLSMFQDCTILSDILTYMTNIPDAYCLYNWLSNVAATGDFYCPASLTIPTGASGIPSGWKRHDI